MVWQRKLRKHLIMGARCWLSRQRCSQTGLAALASSGHRRTPLWSMRSASLSQITHARPLSNLPRPLSNLPRLWSQRDSRISILCSKYGPTDLHLTAWHCSAVASIYCWRVPSENKSINRFRNHSFIQHLYHYLLMSWQSITDLSLGIYYFGCFTTTWCPRLPKSKPSASPSNTHTRAYENACCIPALPTTWAVSWNALLRTQMIATAPPY